jgi:hypothetical protein
MKRDTFLKIILTPLICPLTPLICPMDYTPHSGQFENQVRQQIQWAGKVPCYPGIGLSCWGNAGDVFTLFDQITIARNAGAPGFILFNYGDVEARDIVPLCGMGITRRP